ncbi:hypothetical protein RRG08_024182 [Elysia crispata]|uniref:Uncharacterized protein n=1 Tax=Elysia crispata TaxID=231223 RepID=A0AAE0YQ18_9GAST|nr:hypothetical protein RRG08_024182 [Elysia crispata]
MAPGSNLYVDLSLARAAVKLSPQVETLRPLDGESAYPDSSNKVLSHCADSEGALSTAPTDRCEQDLDLYESTDGSKRGNTLISTKGLLIGYPTQKNQFIFFRCTQHAILSLESKTCATHHKRL